MAVFALIFVLLAGSLMGIVLVIAGAVVGVVVGIPLLGGTARRDARRQGSAADRMILVPFAVVLGMFFLPRFFEAIGLSLGWALSAGVSAFIATAGYVTSRSDAIFGEAPIANGRRR